MSSARALLLAACLLALAACARPAPPPPPFDTDCATDDSWSCRGNHTESEKIECLRTFLLQSEIDRRAPAPKLDRRLAQALDLFERGEQAQALPVIRKYADQGKAEALCALGQALELGLGADADPARAAQAYRAAMARGSAEAAGRLGLMGLLGTAPDLDQDRSMALIRQAAGQGQGDFLFLLAELDARPGPSFQVRERIYCNLARAASCRDPWAMFYLGILYEYDLKDLEQGLVWYWRSATLGHSRAAAAIAKLYEQGRGLPRDDVQALAWYLVAAETRPPRVGTAKAWYIDDIIVGAESDVAPALARLYLHGEGVPRDVPKAAFWAARTRMENRRSVDDLLPEIMAALAPGDWERIQAEAWNWRPSPPSQVKPRLAERLFEHQDRTRPPKE